MTMATSDQFVLEEWAADAASGRLISELRLKRTSPHRLSPAQIEQWDKTGFLLPLEGVSTGEAQAIRIRIEAAERESGTSGNGLFTNAVSSH